VYCVEDRVTRDTEGCLAKTFAATAERFGALAVFASTAKQSSGRGRVARLSETHRASRLRGRGPLAPGGKNACSRNPTAEGGLGSQKQTPRTCTTPHIGAPQIGGPSGTNDLG